MIRIFHFYIITEVTKNFITVVHKDRKEKLWSPALLAGMNEFTEIKEEKIEKEISNDLFDFQSGVYVLGEYSDDQKQKALERLKSTKGKNQIFSFKSCNCEHFSNWIFTGEARSYQAELIASNAIAADVFVEGTRHTLQDISTKGAGSLIIEGCKKGANVLITKAPEAVKLFKSVATKILPIIGAGQVAAVGAIVQAPIEIIQLAYDCNK